MGGDIVVVTVPLRAYRDVPADPLAGKAVIDTDNYYPERDGVFDELEDGSTTTGELLQKHLPEAHVVKGFNNIWFEHLRSLARPGGSADRSALPIAGDDADAKQAATELSVGGRPEDRHPPWLRFDHAGSCSCR